jgi:hypothetical protein
VFPKSPPRFVDQTFPPAPGPWIALLMAFLVGGCEPTRTMDPSPVEEEPLALLATGTDTSFQADSGSAARFSFAPEPGADYQIRACAYTPFRIEVRDAQGRILASGTEESNWTDLNWHAEDSGLLEIVVVGTDSTGWTLGYFSIHRVRHADPFEDDDRPDRARILLPDSSVQQRTLLPGDVDWIRIPAPAGRHVIVHLVRNVDGIGIQAFHADGTPQNHVRDFLVSAVADESGSLLVRVDGAGQDSSSWYDLRAHLDTASEDAFEPDDRPELAIPLAVDSASAPRILATRERDWFRFEAEAGARYRIRLHNRLTLRDPYPLDFTVFAQSEDRQLAAIDGGLAPPDAIGWVYVKPSTSGTFLVVVSGHARATPYGLSVLRLPLPTEPDAFESDDRLSTAGTVPVDGPIQERSLPKNDVDWIRFDADSGRTYDLRDPYARTRLVFQAFRPDSTPLAPRCSTSLQVQAERTGPLFVRIQYIKPQLPIGYAFSVTLEPKVATPRS